MPLALYRAVTAGSGTQISDKNQVRHVPGLPCQWGTSPACLPSMTSHHWEFPRA
jgi:hypothetical protein